MIVLVVTTALFASAALLIGGRQSRVGFSQAVVEMKGQIEQSINQVGSGYYADIGGLGGKRCIAGAGTIDFDAGSTAKGGSGSCMFIGQALQFGVNRSNEPQQFISHTIAARRAVGGQSVQNMQQASPRLVYPDGLNETRNYPDARVSKPLLNGLTISWAQYDNTDIGGFALISNLGDYTAGMLESGTQALSLYPLMPDGLGSTVAQSNPLRTNEQNFARVVNAGLRRLTPDHANPESGVKLCFASGGTNQSALITIGGKGKALGVTQQVFNSNQRCDRP